MASKSAHGNEHSNEAIEEALDAVDKTLDRVKVLYEQYFLGIQKQPPTHLHTDAERKLRDLAHIQIRNTALRYRFAMIQQKLGSYNSYWRRTLRQIENGTYTRNLQKIGRQAARTGADIPEEILAAMPKRMRDQILRDRDAALALARRRNAGALGEGDVDVDLSDDDLSLDESELLDLQPDLQPAPQRPAEQKTATGAHILSENDGDFDMDAFFAEVQAGTIPPPMASVAQRLGAQAIPTIKAEPPTVSPSQLASTGQAAPFVPPLASPSRAATSAATAPTQAVPTLRSSTPPTPTPPGKATQVIPTTPTAPTQALPSLRAATPPSATPSSPPVRPPTLNAARPTPVGGVPTNVQTQPMPTVAPARAVTPPKGVPTSVQTQPMPTVAPPKPSVPTSIPTSAQTQPLPGIRIATPPTGVPANRVATPPTGIPAIPSPTIPPRTATPPAGIPAIPSPSTRVATPPTGVPIARTAPTRPPTTIPTIPVIGPKPASTTAPSQATRPNPIVPGAAARVQPVDVETMAGPFPRRDEVKETKPEPKSEEPKRPARPVEKPAPPPRAEANNEQLRPPPGMSDADVSALYNKYIAAKQSVGEQTGPNAYNKLLKTINAQAPKIMEQYKAKGVDFTVVVKDNQVVIRAKPKGGGG